ncbi:uncharacterized protein LOC121422124 [Lytechinus variegatus]|uniref:uncharacterized protein LOC121422124 n=1 Tax=Lytechinus variegatus TaxID=7654 RepID=UPI001BB1C6CC|nr:uncharacterized protein LOC121422124 [Lytechinus variegatus]
METSRNFSGTDNPQSACSSDVFDLLILIQVSIAGVLPVLTVISIIFNKELRKQQTIMPINIILCDLVLVAIHLYVFAASDQSGHWFFTLLVMLITPLDFTATLSILLAAVIPFITIRFDPFGIRHLITTPRIIVACILSWFLPAVIICPFINPSVTNQLLILAGVDYGFLLLTGLCYALIYLAISSDQSILTMSEERRRENKKVFHTIVLVYLTTLVPKSIYLAAFLIYMYGASDCFMIVGQLTYHLTMVLNTLVYWWRLEEFKSLFARWKQWCKR